MAAADVAKPIAPAAPPTSPHTDLFHLLSPARHCSKPQCFSCGQVRPVRAVQRYQRRLEQGHVAGACGGYAARCPRARAARESGRLSTSGPPLSGHVPKYERDCAAVSAGNGQDAAMAPDWTTLDPLFQAALYWYVCVHRDAYSALLTLFGV